MEYQLWVSECEQLLSRFAQQVQELQAQIRAGTGFAFYQDAKEILRGADARAAIADSLGDYFYDGRESIQLAQPLDRYMAAGCSATTLERVQGLGGLNHTKLLFKRFHEDIRRQFTTEAEATRALRDVLGLCQAKLLNVEAVDRRVPVLPGPALRIAWFINQSAASVRATIGDAVAQLLRLQEQAGGDRLDMLNQEIAQLRSLPASLPVAHRLRRPVKVLKFRSSIAEGSGQRRMLTDYGKNPVLFLDQGVEPTLVLPASSKSGDGRGRPSTISDLCVSPSLPNWFFYREQSISPDKPAPAQSRGRKNPHASTAIAGIWFYRNASGNPGFRYRRPNGRVSSVAIKRAEEGMYHAWTTAIDKAWPDKGDHEKEGLYALCPSREALAKFLDGFMTASEHINNVST